jgi:hypothetical protein
MKFEDAFDFHPEKSLLRVGFPGLQIFDFKLNKLPFVVVIGLQAE